MNKELIFSLTKKDFVIEWYSGHGAGGQKRNKTQNCCRIKHLESKTDAKGTEQRSREQNKKKAFLRLTSDPEFLKWLRIETARQCKNFTEEKIDVDKWVEEQLNPENLKIEYL